MSSPVADACSPSFSSSRPIGESRCARRDDERADLGRTVVAGAAAGGDDVRAGLSRVRDEPLAAVDDPRPSVRTGLEPGGRPRTAGVTAGARFGQPVAAKDRALRHGHEVARLLVVRAGKVERAAAEARVGGDDEPEAAPDPADLLDRDRVGQRIEAGAALVLGDRDAEPAHRAEAVHDRPREAARLLVFVDDRCDLADHEVADGLTQEPMLRGEVEVHGPQGSTGQVAGGWPGLDGARAGAGSAGTGSAADGRVGGGRGVGGGRPGLRHMLARRSFDDTSTAEASDLVLAHAPTTLGDAPRCIDPRSYDRVRNA